MSETNARDLVRAIHQQYPNAAVQVVVQPHPGPTETMVTYVSVLWLPGALFPEVREGDYGDDFVVAVVGPDVDDQSSTLTVTRYHDDDIIAALQAAVDYISTRAGVRS